jgi:antitoxin component YwqK of YwqJK toxin-antitoxin module
MKKSNLKFFAFCVALMMSSVVFYGCNDDETEVKETYITPIWKGQLETAPENPQAGWAYYNVADKKSYIYDGSQWQVFAQDGVAGEIGPKGEDGLSSDEGLVFCGETTETIDNETYTVKSYAQVFGDTHFYNYYKYYYQNEKLVRTKYFEYDNDDKYIAQPYTDFDESKFEGEYTEKVYYPSGKIKIHRRKGYNNNFKTEFYENGKEKQLVYYDENGNETSIWEYVYYDNGNRKSEICYLDGVISVKSEYYDNGNRKGEIRYKKGVIDYENYNYQNYESMLSVSYELDGSLHSFTYYYESGYTKYHWGDSYLYSYHDNERESFEHKEYTENQALEFLKTLRP